MGYSLFTLKQVVSQLLSIDHKLLFSENYSSTGYVAVFHPEQVTSTVAYDAYDYLLDLVSYFVYVWSGDWGHDCCVDSDQFMRDNAR